MIISYLIIYLHTFCASSIAWRLLSASSMRFFFSSASLAFFSASSFLIFSSSAWYYKVFFNKANIKPLKNLL